MNAQSAHSQRGPPTAVGAEVESHRLLRTGLKGRKCQGEGPLGCRDRQDGWAGPLHEQASRAAVSRARGHPLPPGAGPRSLARWQEGSPTEGRLLPACPKVLTGRGGNLANDGPPAFLSLVNTWKSMLFYKKGGHAVCQCQTLGPTSAMRPGAQRPSAQC